MIHATLTRAEYARSLAAGNRFRGAYLYEVGTDTKATFFYVERGDGFCVLKRQL